MRGENTSVNRTLRLLSVALATGIIVAACSGGNSPTTNPGASTAPGGSSAPTAAAGAISITGAGSTFVNPIFSTWFYRYAFVDPSVAFNYQAIGSGAGIQQITAKTVDFGASDAILTSDQITAAPSIQMYPDIAGATVLAYNISALKGQPPITLDGTTTASIFLGKITNWNDPAIATLNPGVTLPDLPIVVVHRSDGSGTTFIFTDYLSNVSPDWKTQVGNSTSVQWPVGLGGKGNDGVTGVVTQTDGAIGYIELAYATQNKLTFANMNNAAGKNVTASVDSTTAALNDFSGQMPDTLARSIVNAPGAASWPIAGYSYLLLYQQATDCTKAQKIVEWFRWALGPAGTGYATPLQYVPVPANVQQQEQAKLAQMTCNGQPIPS
jgi:phosphate transport system substrate-binding protein